MDYLLAKTCYQVISDAIYDSMHYSGEPGSNITDTEIVELSVEGALKVAKENDLYITSHQAIEEAAAEVFAHKFIYTIAKPIKKAEEKRFGKSDPITKFAYIKTKDITLSESGARKALIPVYDFLWQTAKLVDSLKGKKK